MELNDRLDRMERMLMTCLMKQVGLAAEVAALSVKCDDRYRDADPSLSLEAASSELVRSFAQVSQMTKELGLEDVLQAVMASNALADAVWREDLGIPHTEQEH